MHYKNGREAKIGDEVIQVQNGTARGLLYDTMGGAKQCSARIASFHGSDPYVSTGDCLHIDDVLEANIPDSTRPRVGDAVQEAK